MFDRRALLFDLGDLSPLPPRKLLRITDVFVSHRHMDHFSGFDHPLRFVLRRDQIFTFYGPPGLIKPSVTRSRPISGTWWRATAPSCGCGRMNSMPAVA